MNRGNYGPTKFSFLSSVFREPLLKSSRGDNSSILLKWAFATDLLQTVLESQPRRVIGVARCDFVVRRMLTYDV